MGFCLSVCLFRLSGSSIVLKRLYIHHQTFYRAMLCVSADFAVGRCLSVCLSRWWIVSRRLKISSNFFLGPVAPSLCFLTLSANTQYQGEPLQRRHKIHGVEFFCDFRLKSPLISETVLDRPFLLWNVNRKS